MSYLIDTDLLSFLRRTGRSCKLERFVAAREAEIFVSVVTWAEIEHGITLTEEAFQNDLLQWVAGVRAQFAGATLPLDEAVLVRWKQLLAEPQRGAKLDLFLPRRGRRWGFEFKCSDAPGTTKSMHIAIEDLKLEHLWVVYPGTLRYPLAEKITALPLGEIHFLEPGEAS